MTSSMDRAIARALVARPDAKTDFIRRAVPETRGVPEHALAQKLDYLRRRARETAAGLCRTSGLIRGNRNG
ncbi:hypothetical protein [Ancylobacter sp. TS-1]|uniref:hypothetical protein n=1 Tax=Ancylobacter sp. TS-1 TaxID=1850374 RepID=UPI001265C59F|nr:hypothetical protein [Ancylobacter sp. TS-1]QFR34691.1 hypothetical protein GBB76_17155 [Ancylobacter sp. TS-1]